MATHIHIIEPYALLKNEVLAQYRAIPHLVGLVRKAHLRGADPKLIVPDAFTMGIGHLRFFYNKLTFISRRHQQIVADMQVRGLHPSLTHELRSVNQDIPERWWNDWTPSEVDIAVDRRYLETSVTTRKAMPYKF